MNYESMLLHIGHSLVMEMVPATELHAQRVRLVCTTCNITLQESAEPEITFARPFHPYLKSDTQGGKLTGKQKKHAKD
jgi:hypothetical protein